MAGPVVRFEVMGGWGRAWLGGGYRVVAVGEGVSVERSDSGYVVEFAMDRLPLGGVVYAVSDGVDGATSVVLYWFMGSLMSHLHSHVESDVVRSTVTVRSLEAGGGGVHGVVDPGYEPSWPSITALSILYAVSRARDVVEAIRGTLRLMGVRGSGSYLRVVKPVDGEWARYTLIDADGREYNVRGGVGAALVGLARLAGLQPDRATGDGWMVEERYDIARLYIVTRMIPFIRAFKLLEPDMLYTSDGPDILDTLPIGEH